MNNDAKIIEGVCLDLHESNFVYESNDYIFYFSSLFYFNKFKESVEDYVRIEKLRFNNRYQCNVENDDIFILKLYKKIEKRGFFVKRKALKNTELQRDYNVKIDIL